MGSVERVPRRSVPLDQLSHRDAAVGVWLVEQSAKLFTDGSTPEQPAVIAAEWGLVVLLAAHMAGGLRLLALELLPWREWQKALAAAAAGFAIFAGLVFALAR